MGILESLENLNVTNECFCDIIEEIINEISNKKIGNKTTGTNKFIDFLRDQVDKIEDREEKEQAKTEVVKYEHKVNPQISRIENKVIKRIVDGKDQRK